MEPITELELDSLPVEGLVARMDAFLMESEMERYGCHAPSSVPLVQQVMATAEVRSKDEQLRRKIAYICFSYLMQLQMNSVASGMTNKVLYTPQYTEQDWSSPVFRLREGALRQYQTVGSRIAFEVFIDVLYLIENGVRLEGRKSKIGAFRVWLKDINNRFHYFAHVLLAAYHFDRRLRTPEVHGSSRLPRCFLTLQVPAFTELNEHLQLSNKLMYVWPALIDILNHVRPTFMHIDETESHWFQAYTSGNEREIEERLDMILSWE
jgi:hypothetical protein